MEYTVVIRKASDGIYIASCPALPEVHTQGSTRDECLANAREAVELAMDDRKAHGEEIPVEEVTATKVRVGA